MKYIILICLISSMSFAKDKTVDPNDPEWVKCLQTVRKTCGQSFKCRIHELVKCNNKQMAKQK